MSNDPTVFSETARRDLDDDVRYADTFYWDADVSTQIITYDPVLDQTVNTLGFGPQSDVWKEYAWMEICPKQRRLVLHRKGDGSPYNRLSWDCGRGDDQLIQTAECADVVSCTFKNVHVDTKGIIQGLFVSHFGSYSTPTVPVMLDGLGEMYATPVTQGNLTYGVIK